METTKIKLAQLEPNKGQIEGLPSNPRTWTQSEIDKIARSLRETPELFEMRPIIVQKQGDKYIILGGNLRYEGAKQNGDKEVPCIVVPDWYDVDKLKQIVIKDNGSFGEWDFDALANEWNDLPLTDWGVLAGNQELGEKDIEENTAEEDNFDEEREEIPAVCQEGDIWQLGQHRLMCSDSTAAASVALLMNGEHTDLLLTDPPYNVAYVGKTKDALTIANDRLSDAEFATFLDGAFAAAASVLKAGGAFYVWSAQGHAQTDIAAALDRAGLFFRQQIIWVKNVLVLGRMDYQGKHEPCFYGWKEGAGHYFRDTRSETTVIPDEEELDFDKMKKDEMRELLRRIYETKIPISIIHEDKPARSEYHPTMKPVRLFGQLIINSTKPGEAVLDTFGGSGTTLIAAEQLGRKCYMMELDPHYCDVIIARWEKLTGRKAEKVNK